MSTVFPDGESFAHGVAVNRSRTITHGSIERIGNKWFGLFPQQAENGTPGCELCACHMADHYLVDGDILICPGQLSELDL